MYSVHEARNKRKKFPGKTAKKKIVEEDDEEQDEEEEDPAKKVLTPSDAEIWATGCLFSCQMCNPTTLITGQDEFTSHLQKSHNTPFYKYAKQFQDYKLVSGFHSCKVNKSHTMLFCIKYCFLDLSKQCKVGPRSTNKAF